MIGLRERLDWPDLFLHGAPWLLLFLKGNSRFDALASRGSRPAG